MEITTNNLQASAIEVAANAPKLSELEKPMAAINKVRHAHQQLKVRELQSDELLEIALKQCIALCGIKGNNFPSKAQFILMVNAVRNNLGDFSPEEIKLAFELYLAGDFSIKKGDFTTYQNFTFEAVASVCKTYRSWRTKRGYLRGLKAKEEKAQEDPTANELATWQVMQADILQPYMEAQATGVPTVTLSDPWGTLWSAVDENGYLQASMELMLFEYTNARKLVIDRGPRSTNPSTRKDFKQFESEQFLKLSRAQRRKNSFHNEAAKIAGRVVLHTYLSDHLKKGTDLYTQWKKHYEYRLSQLNQNPKP